jgi:C-terminal processing protease CtpA/Prc
MNDQYFWSDRQSPPLDAATTMAQYFNSLLYSGVDRYSSSQTTDQFLEFFQEGKRIGYGYSLAWADAAQTQLVFRLVEPLSPLGLAGLRRGDAVVSIDGFSPSQVAAGALPVVATLDVPRQFVVADGNGLMRTIVVNSAEYAVSPVLHATVLTAPNGAKVGYLAYQEFLSTGAAAVGAAVDSFRAAGISELVLDLRYNGGGSTTQARNMASLLGGTGLNGKVFAHYRFNAKNAGSNVVQTFTSSLAALPTSPLAGLGRVFVITSGGTASASEMVINGLRPYMPVILIGGTTFGKPFGSQPRDSCGTTYSAINIEISNALGSADFTSGFAPTCAMSDDLSRQWGDPAERRTAAALAFIATGLCPAEAASTDAVARVAMASRADATKERLHERGIGEIGPPRAWLD